jgi:outer membrane lipoprotein SlyB
MNYSKFAALAAVSCLAACTALPSGPSVTAMPGTGKSFDQFRADDASCRQFASDQVGGVSANQAATNTALGSAAVGTALGAAAGAAFNGGRGAAVGAGAGLLAGSLFGTSAAQSSGYENQRRYDSAYLQCMYGSGERVPYYGRMIDATPGNGPQGGPPPSPPMLPPPGVQPPPPPGY